MNILIIWGGYGLHQPEQISRRLAELLLSKEHAVTATSDFYVILNEDLRKYDVLVPVWSRGIRDDWLLQFVLRAIDGGLGLACFHGAIDFFDQREYCQLVGGLYINDSNYESFRVRISANCGEAFDGLQDFQGGGEIFNCMLDMSNHVIAHIEADRFIRPYAWTRRYGKGKIFYSMGAHDIDTLFSGGCMDIILRGIDWSAREEEGRL